MIHAEITLGGDYVSHINGNTIEEIIAKIQEFHTMSAFEKAHYGKKNMIEKELATGWYMKETDTLITN